MRKAILNGNYEITEDGQVYSLISHRFIKGGIYPNGYRFLRIREQEEYKNYLVHRLVAQAFIPNPDNLPVVNHIDGNKLNNRVDNLEWCTQSDNLKHAIEIGLVENQCKIRRSVEMRNLTTGELITFDSAKECCEYFGHKKGWLAIYQKTHGNPCNYKGFLIFLSPRGGRLCD